MESPFNPTSEPSVTAPSQELFPAVNPVILGITFDQPAGAFRFEWTRSDSNKVIALGFLSPDAQRILLCSVLNWQFESFEPGGTAATDFCGAAPSSVHALLRRIRQQFLLGADDPRIGLLTDTDLGMAKAGKWLPIKLPPKIELWKWLGRHVVEFARLVESTRGPENLAHFLESGERPPPAPAGFAQKLMGLLVGEIVRGPRAQPGPVRGAAPARAPLNLRVTLNVSTQTAEFMWSERVGRVIIACGTVRCSGPDRLSWELDETGRMEQELSATDQNSIRTMLNRWLVRFGANAGTFTAFYMKRQPGSVEPLYVQETPFASDASVVVWLESALITLGEQGASPSSPLQREIDRLDYDLGADAERQHRRLVRKEEKRAEEAARRQANIARLAEERRRHDERAAVAARTVSAAKNPPVPAAPRPRPAAPLPPVPVTIKLPPLVFQDTAFPLADLRDFELRGRAAVWWVSNQSDDLLCLPNCRIQRLEYQVRTALRVLGPLRGRALLSDEVGLGKTVEAGLVLKELLTRGMVKRYLVLTLPSLVDQWAEELNDKFGLTTATTNESRARDATVQFWRESPGIVASLHTLKQPAHLAVARELHWDLLIVDEAHYLRNRDSLAWQAVNVLPRQFLLLLTATPVQNSLEELYNLVTLLMPGQLPTPREFRARFLDPKRPRQPREPEELRRLLGQVMIRNTRANAGVDLPPRHAETVLFTPDEKEGAFWQQWETEFRACLVKLSASQASLWGRLLLRAAGSSPAAWRSALKKFPEAAAARTWHEHAPLSGSWQKKCTAIIPLARGEGGVVLFTEFLETQAALAEFLRGAGVPTFVINGATPAPERQPLTEQFRREGGALILTHSGTEGRNLQFCHCLANFDLPWNPMQIEQRIGRLHRLGQKQPVRIYNFVQAGTLQEHLLEILQDKLNLFELVVGETGLVLGERFSGDEFEEEIFRRWRESEGRVAEALAGLGAELAAARDQYGEVKQLDETLFAQNYESL